MNKGNKRIVPVVIYMKTIAGCTVIRLVTLYSVLLVRGNAMSSNWLFFEKNKVFDSTTNKVVFKKQLLSIYSKRVCDMFHNFFGIMWSACPLLFLCLLLIENDRSICRLHLPFWKFSLYLHCFYLHCAMKIKEICTAH